MRLNVNAHVPGIPSDGGDIGTKPLRPVDKAQLAGPITIDTGGRPPGASRGFRDYIPSSGKRRQILKARGAVVEESRPEDTVHTRHVVRHKGTDYLSGEESAKRRKKQESDILTAAKSLWGAEAIDRKRYKMAKKIVSEATEKDIMNPSPRLKRAMAVLDGKAPITKKEALRQARAKMYRE